MQDHNETTNILTREKEQMKEEVKREVKLVLDSEKDKAFRVIKNTSKCTRT